MTMPVESLIQHGTPLVFNPEVITPYIISNGSTVDVVGLWGYPVTVTDNTEDWQNITSMTQLEERIEKLHYYVDIQGSVETLRWHKIRNHPVLRANTEKIWNAAMMLCVNADRAKSKYTAPQYRVPITLEPQERAALKALSGAMGHIKQKKDVNRVRISESMRGIQQMRGIVESNMRVSYEDSVEIIQKALSYLDFMAASVVLSKQEKQEIQSIKDMVDKVV